MVYTHIWGIAEKVSSSFPKVIYSDSGKWVMLRTFQHPLYINVLISFTDVLRILTWQLPIRQQKMKRYSGAEIASLLKVVRHFMFKVRNCWKCLVHSQERNILSSLISWRWPSSPDLNIINQVCMVMNNKFTSVIVLGVISNESCHTTSLPSTGL